jgi:hypothetical protein
MHTTMQAVFYQPLKAHKGKVIGCITVQDPKLNAQASFSYEDQQFDVKMTLGLTIFNPGGW